MARPFPAGTRAPPIEWARTGSCSGDGTADDSCAHGGTTVSRRGWALFALMGVIWGVPYLLIKVAVSDLSPPTLVFLRTAIGAAILLPLAVTRGELAPLRRHWKIILAYTIVEVAGPWLLLSH